MTIIFEKYLSKVRELPENCAFRGQKNNAWKLHSAATRRLVKHYHCDEGITTLAHFSQIYMIYHRVALLEPARTNGFGVDDGQRISDLQLLAKLQHFGTATGLIDFTWDPLVALWFACESFRDKEGKESNGKVFAIDLSDPTQFQKLSSEEETQSAEELFSPARASEMQLYWEPMVRGEATPRVLRQQSVFVIGRPIVPENFVTSIEIGASDKQEILKELEGVLNINRHTLFADLQGFSAVNGAKSFLRTIESPVNYLLQGNQFCEQKDFKNAVSSYDKCIVLDEDASEPYVLRGNAKTELKEYTGAELDFDLAIRYRERPFQSWKRGSHRVAIPSISWSLFFNRGNVKAALTDFEGALADYDEAIRLFQQLGSVIPTLFFNRGNANFMLHRFEEAVDDFSEAIVRGEKNAFFNKGNALALLGRFEEAIRCFDEGIEGVEDRTDFLGNRNWAQYILEKTHGLVYQVHGPGSEKVAGLMTIDVSMDSSDKERSIESLVFKGNTGNSGNVGFNGSPGTKGFPGFMGFVVRI